jgi:AcrR family transcriptional regulator
MARQAERREATRGAILAAARSLFGAEGFPAVSVERIAAEAGVAKGAVYHHFATKEAVFEAVFEAVSQDLAAEVGAASAGASDVLAVLSVASAAYVAACARPALRRIVLEEGPAVLGWARWREIDDRHFGVFIPGILGRAMREGLIGPQPVGPLARVLQGAMSEAALAAAAGEDPAAILAALSTLIDGLRLERSAIA